MSFLNDSLVSSTHDILRNRVKYLHMPRHQLKGGRIKIVAGPRTKQSKIYSHKKNQKREGLSVWPTPVPLGKQRQKKSGRGRPTPSLIASVITAVTNTENRRPVRVYKHVQSVMSRYKKPITTIAKTTEWFWWDENH